MFIIKTQRDKIGPIVLRDERILFLQWFLFISNFEIHTWLLLNFQDS